MFDRYRRATTDAEELDLLPVMNLFMVLIPFLLMGAAFFHIAVIPTSLPTHTPQASDVPTTPTTVSVNLAITPTDMVLTVSSTSFDEQQLAKMGATFRKSGGQHNVDALIKHLKGLKTDYPKSNTLIVLPDENVKYEDLVAILDASRDFKTGARDKDGEYVRQDLFPVVVFSRFIPPDAVPIGEDGPQVAEEVDAQEVAPSP